MAGASGREDDREVHPVLLVLLVWSALSIPAGVVVGRMLAVGTPPLR